MHGFMNVKFTRDVHERVSLQQQNVATVRAAQPHGVLPRVFGLCRNK
jgi:hypothetical protein